MSKLIPRGRAKDATSWEQSLSRSHDRTAQALAVRDVAHPVRYLTETELAASGACPPRMHERVIEGVDADDPNAAATEPSHVTTPRSFVAAAECDEAVMFFEPTSGAQSMTVDVWAKTDVRTDPADVASRRVWVLVYSAQLLPYVEHRFATGRRELFFRVREATGVEADPAHATLRATCH